MPVFKVTEKGAEKPRYGEAVSRAAALNHVIAGRFETDIVKNPAAVVKLARDGVDIEDWTGEPVAPSGPVVSEENQGGAGAAPAAEAKEDGPGDPPPSEAAIEAQATQSPRGNRK